MKSCGSVQHLLCLHYVEFKFCLSWQPSVEMIWWNVKFKWSGESVVSTTKQPVFALSLCKTLDGKIPRWVDRATPPKKISRNPWKRKKRSNWYIRYLDTIEDTYLIHIMVLSRYLCWLWIPFMISRLILPVHSFVMSSPGLVALTNGIKCRVSSDVVAST